MIGTLHIEPLAYGGRHFLVAVDRDGGMGPPWIEHDGHGPVEERTFRGHVHCPTAPGERVLHIDDGTAWVYDVQKAQQTALRDGWGISDETRRDQLLRGLPLTRRRIAALAVQQDMDTLRGWLRDDWCWAVVTVALQDAYGAPTERSSSLGGMDWGLPGSEANIMEEARQLADEILHEMRASPSVTVTESVTAK